MSTCTHRQTEMGDIGHTVTAQGAGYPKLLLVTVVCTETCLIWSVWSHPALQMPSRCHLTKTVPHPRQTLHCSKALAETKKGICLPRNTWMVRNGERGENKHSSELSNKGNTTAAALLQRKMSFGQDATLCLLVVLQTAGAFQMGCKFGLQQNSHSP